MGVVSSGERTLLEIHRHAGAVRDLAGNALAGERASLLEGVRHRVLRSPLMTPLEVVIDTNVLIAALRSRHGGSAALLQELGADPRWQMNLSVSLAAEYTEIVHREGPPLGYTWQDCEDFLDYICAAGVERPIYFRWRPALPDPDDDLVLELAVACGTAHIITHNRRHFAEAAQFGNVALSPAEFLTRLRTLT